MPKWIIMENIAINLGSLYDEVKATYKSAEKNGCIDPSEVEKIKNIQEQFASVKDWKGVIYCYKGLSIVFERLGDSAFDENERITYYEKAHEAAIEAVIEASNRKWKQPSLPKRLGQSKQKLADALHTSGFHADAEILEGDASRIFSKLLKEFPDYGEGYFASANASFIRLKWAFRKLKNDLRRSETLFQKPIHTQHLPDENERNGYLNQIQQMQSTLHKLLSLAN